MRGLSSVPETSQPVAGQQTRLNINNAGQQGPGFFKNSRSRL